MVSKSHYVERFRSLYQVHISSRLQNLLVEGSHVASTDGEPAIFICNIILASRLDHETFPRYAAYHRV